MKLSSYESSLKKEEAKIKSIKKPISPINSKTTVNPFGSFFPFKSILEKKIMYTKASTPNTSKNCGPKPLIASNGMR